MESYTTADVSLRRALLQLTPATVQPQAAPALATSGQSIDIVA